jgi:hypothetical protein
MIRPGLGRVTPGDPMPFSVHKVFTPSLARSMQSNVVSIFSNIFFLQTKTQIQFPTQFLKVMLLKIAL